MSPGCFQRGAQSQESPQEGPRESLQQTLPRPAGTKPWRHHPGPGEGRSLGSAGGHRASFPFQGRKVINQPWDKHLASGKTSSAPPRAPDTHSLRPTRPVWFTSLRPSLGDFLHSQVQLRAEWPWGYLHWGSATLWLGQVSDVRAFRPLAKQIGAGEVGASWQTEI